MAQDASLPTKQFSSNSSSFQEAMIIPMRQKILPRHRLLLMRWLEAGEKMGLLDAQIIPQSSHSSKNYSFYEYVVIWVRENSNPAYLIEPKGTNWCLIDALQKREIGRYQDFTTALNHIRPALHPCAALSLSY